MEESPVQDRVTAGAPAPAQKALRVFASSSLSTLVQAMTSDLESARFDPFLSPLVVTPGPAHHRHVSQAIARSNSFGICAGVEFASPGALRRRLGHHLGWPQDDPWAHGPLTRMVLRAFDLGLDESWARTLRGHLQDPAARPGRRITTAGRLAELYLRYGQHRVQMLRSWDLGDLVGPDGGELPSEDHWQAHLWRRVRNLADAPSPFEREQELLTALSDGTLAEHLPPAVHVLAVDALPPRDVALLLALAEQVPTTVWQLESAVPGAPLARLARVHELARSGWARHGLEPHRLDAPARSASDLGRLQAAVTGDPVPGQGRGGFTIIGSHGPSRQVEVLRDYLCGLFQDDPTLEPRDVAIVSPAVHEHAALVDAGMVITPASDDPHPAHQLRTVISHREAGRPNEVLDMLVRVTRLRTTRATWQDLVELCLSRPVATRFGFGADGGDRLRMLVEKAQVQWGIDDQHRRQEGIAHAGGTWLAGVDSLSLGAALADDPLVTVGNRLPAVALDSQYADLAGALGEFVSRIRKFHHEAQATTAAEWNTRLQSLVADLAAMPRSENWQVAAARALIAEWALGGHDEAVLGLGDVAGVLSDLAQAGRMRPSFGTGAMVFSGLADLAAIPHRVIVVLGLDDEYFPGTNPELGDDLLAGYPNPVPLRRDLAKQHLLDALLAATEQFTVIHQAHSEHSLQRLDEPVAVGELRRAAEQAGVRVHEETWAPLAWSSENFQADESRGEQAHSFDPRASRAFVNLSPVTARRSPAEVAAHPYSVREPDRVVDVEDLIKFFRHPVRAFLDARAGVNLEDWRSSQTASIPLVTDHLMAWQLKVRALDLSRRGQDPQEIERSLLGMATVPPTRAAHQELVKDIRTGIQLGIAVRERDLPEGLVRVDLAIPDGPRLVGAVPTVGGRVEVLTVSSRVPAKDLVAGWIRTLAVALATGTEPVLVVTNPKGSRAWYARGDQDPLGALSFWVHARQHGLEHPLIAPLKTLQRAPDDPYLWDTWGQERKGSWVAFTPERVKELLAMETCLGDSSGCQKLTVTQLAPLLFEQFVEGDD